jgi:CrcB protein
MDYLIVFIGAGIGGALRHGINVFMPRLAGAGFPYHTLTINVTGSLIMGLVAEYFAFRGQLPQSWRLFLATGLLGGYTTFSAFSLETILLCERGQLLMAALYVVASVVLSVGALFTGLVLVRSLT